MTKFEDIHITGMDKEHSKLADSYGFIEIHLKLSSMPDNDWSQIFRQMYKRSRNLGEVVKLSGTHIVMKTRREWAKALKDKLETDVADTNSEYRKHINERARRKAADEEAQRVKQEKEREQLDDIDRLLFGGED